MRESLVTATAIIAALAAFLVGGAAWLFLCLEVISLWVCHGWVCTGGDGDPAGWILIILSPVELSGALIAGMAAAAFAFVGVRWLWRLRPDDDQRRSGPPG